MKHHSQTGLMVLSGLVLSASALWAPPAQASEGYAEAWGALLGGNANRVGPNGQWGLGTQLGARAGINDFWSIVGGVDLAWQLATTIDADPPIDVPATAMLGFFGGFRYNLDMFTYVPYVGLALENYVQAPGDQQGESGPNLGAKLTIGLDWRFAREYSFGALIELHTALDDPAAFPIYSSAGLSFGYHFRL